MGFVLLLVLLVLAVIIAVTNLCIVPQGSNWVVERLGKYHDTWQPGLHLKTPILERIARKISMKEQKVMFEKLAEERK